MKKLRWLLPLIVVAVLAWFLHGHWDMVYQALQRVATADPRALAVAVVASFAAFVAMAEVLRNLLYAGSTVVRRRDCFNLVAASNAWSATLPGGQAFAALLNFHTMRRWGASALLCSWQIVLSGALSTMWLVALGGCAVFLFGASLSLVSLLVSFVVMAAVAVAVYYVSHHPQTLLPPALCLLKLVNVVRRRPPTQGSERVAQQLAQLDTVLLSPKRFAVVAVWSLLNWLADVVVLWACIWSVTGQLHSLPMTAIVLAFVTAKLAGTVQATPGGLGPVEAALTGALVTVGLPTVAALSTVLIYRLITLFLMTAFGWIVYGLVFSRRSDIRDLRAH